MEFRYRPTFRACYEEFAELEGQPFTVLAAIEEPDATHDAEVLPMFRLAIAGREIEAWPEEVVEEDE